MASEGVEKRYAQALFQVAEDKKQAWQFVTDLNGVEKALQTYPDLEEALLSPRGDKEVKKSILKQLFAERVSPPVLNFLFVLIDKDRFENLSGMLKTYTTLCLEAKGEMEVRVETAVPLPEELKISLTQALSRQKGKEVRLTTGVNPELLGGMVITMGDRLLDLSLKGRLKAIQENLK